MANKPRVFSMTVASITTQLVATTRESMTTIIITIMVTPVRKLVAIMIKQRKMREMRLKSMIMLMIIMEIDRAASSKILKIPN